MTNTLCSKHVEVQKNLIKTLTKSVHFLVNITLTHILCSVTFFFPESRVVNEIMWKNVVEPDRSQVTIQYGACASHAG